MISSELLCNISEWSWYSVRHCTSAPSGCTVNYILVQLTILASDWSVTTRYLLWLVNNNSAATPIDLFSQVSPVNNSSHSVSFANINQVLEQFSNLSTIFHKMWGKWVKIFRVCEENSWQIEGCQWSWKKMEVRTPRSRSQMVEVKLLPVETPTQEVVTGSQR